MYRFFQMIGLGVCGIGVYILTHVFTFIQLGEIVLGSLFIAGGAYWIYTAEQDRDK